MIRLAAFFLGAGTLLFSGGALACATCLAGDPTLTLIGAEKPYAGRKRVALEWLDRSEDMGVAGFNQVTIDEQRWTLGLSYTPIERLSVGLRLPWIKKQREDASLARASTQTFGDLEVTAKLHLQPVAYGMREAYGVIFGVRLPTAEEQFKSNGLPLDIDVQPGTGAVTPHLGAWFARFAYPWFWHVSSIVHVANEGWQEFRAGPALVSSLTAQRALAQGMALQLALDTRWSEKDEYAGIADPNSGGFIAFLSPGLVYNLRTDLLLNLRIQLPVVDALNGDHDESTTIGIGLTYDF
ncbi:MAG: hypothetical protein ACFCUJ_02905 [Thiotrichales bacterium]